MIDGDDGDDDDDGDDGGGDGGGGDGGDGGDGGSDVDNNEQAHTPQQICKSAGIYKSSMDFDFLDELHVYIQGDR